jgi:hypothetical protein
MKKVIFIVFIFTLHCFSSVNVTLVTPVASSIIGVQNHYINLSNISDQDFWDTLKLVGDTINLKLYDSSNNEVSFYYDPLSIDISNKKGFIISNIVVDTVVHTYYLRTSGNYNSVLNSNVISIAGNIASYSFSEKDGDVLHDRTSTYDGAILYHPILGVNGVCGLKQKNTLVKYDCIQEINEFSNSIQNFSISGIFTLDDVDGENYFILSNGYDFFDQFYIMTYMGECWVMIGGYWTLAYCTFDCSDYITNNEPFMLSITYDASLYGKDRIKIKINKIDVDFTLEGDLPPYLNIGLAWYISAINGSTDELNFSIDTKTSDYLNLLYDEIFGYIFNMQ